MYVSLPGHLYVADQLVLLQHFTRLLFVNEIVLQVQVVLFSCQ